MKNIKILGRQYIIEPYVRFPIIGIRKYSAIDKTAVQLSKDLEYVYNDLIRNTPYSLSLSEFEVIKKNILIGNYILSPIRFKGVNKKNLRHFICDIEDDCPDYTYYQSDSNPDLIIVIMPEKEDNLVLMALSRMLYRLSKGGLPKNDYRLANEEEEFYSSIQRMGTLHRLYHIDISDTDITAYQIINWVKLYVKEYSLCYFLTRYFLNLPYKDSKGSLVFLNRLPLAGEISRVLKNIAYINIVDKQIYGELDKLRLTYSRYMSTIIIALKSEDDEDIFDEYTANFYMGFFGLNATINYIEPGDEPIQCGYKKIVLNNDGKVFVY